MSSTNAVVLELNNTLTPAIAIEILPQGLVVNSILLNADGETNDIVQGPFDSTIPGQHANPGPYRFMNTIVGRYSNRIPVKEDGHLIEKNGYSGNVKVIKNEGETVSLHGGPNALDTKVFERITDPKQSVLFSLKELEALQKSGYSSAIFTATEADGFNGFPGAVRYEVLFTVIDPSKPSPASTSHIDLGSILIVYRARLTEPGKITPINLTQHWGFNLESSLRNNRNLDIRDHFLTLNSPARVAVDQVLLPTGQLASNEGTEHEHKSKKIGDKYPNPGYDHFYLFSKEAYDASIATQPTRPPVSELTGLDLLTELLVPGPTKQPSVELWSDKSNYKLQFSSNQGGVQFYTGIGQSGAGTRKPIHGGSANSDGYPQHGAAYLEFHDPLSAFLHNQNGIDSLLTSDELYHNYVKVDISFKPTARS